MMCKVRFCGPATDLTGERDRGYELRPDTTLGALAGRIAEDFPKLGSAVGVRLAVNHQYLPLDYLLRDGDEVAVIPPVSGG
jgi:molybdopterin converting factor small subunit